MLPLITTVFVASLLGSAHCVGMCGPFALIASAQRDQAAGRISRWPIVNYHLGRLIVYVIIGALFGLLGQTLDFGASLAGVQRGATMAAGIGMITVGMIAIGKQFGLRLPLPDAGKPLHRLSSKLFAKTKHLKPTRRALMMGMMTSVMPCGWLYAFAIAAGGTGSIGLGMLTMSAFWLGSVPLLATVMVGATSLFGKFQARLPLVMSMALVVVGLITLVVRVPVVVGQDTIKVTNVSDAIEHVEDIDHEKLPCCQPK